MIKITKNGEPNSLAVNKTAWLNALMEYINADLPVPNNVYHRYNQPDVKVSLKAECNKKCMYCESKVDHVSRLHIEHIKPKAKDKYPELTFEYDNLGLACPMCNGNKSDIYDPDLPFINPYIDNPEDHFYAFGAFVWPKAGDQRARLTDMQIDLNRPELVEIRGERLKIIKNLVHDYLMEQNQTIKAALKKEILREVENDKIYSFCCTAYVEAMLQ